MPTDTPPEPLAPNPPESPPAPEIDPSSSPVEVPNSTPSPDDDERPMDALG